MTPLLEAIARVREVMPEYDFTPSEKWAFDAILTAAEDAEKLRAALVKADEWLASPLLDIDGTDRADDAKVAALEARLEKVIAAGRAMREAIGIHDRMHGSQCYACHDALTAWDRAIAEGEQA